MLFFVCGAPGQYHLSFFVYAELLFSSSFLGAVFYVFLCASLPWVEIFYSYFTVAEPPVNSFSASFAFAVLPFS